MADKQNELGGLDWDSFNDDDEGGYSLGEIKPADAPKACSIDNPDCEACQ